MHHDTQDIVNHNELEEGEALLCSILYVINLTLMIGYAAAAFFMFAEGVTFNFHLRLFFGLWATLIAIGCFCLNKTGWFISSSKELSWTFTMTWIYSAIAIFFGMIRYS